MEEILEEFSDSAIEQVRSLTPDFFTKDIQRSFSQLSDLNLTQSLPVLPEYFPEVESNETSLASYPGDDDEDDGIEGVDAPLDLYAADDGMLADQAKMLVEDVLVTIDLKDLEDTLEKAATDAIGAGKTSLARQVRQGLCFD